MGRKWGVGGMVTGGGGVKPITHTTHLRDAFTLHPSLPFPLNPVHSESCSATTPCPPPCPCPLCPPPPSPQVNWGVPNEIDLIAASFVRKGSDLDLIREVLGEKGR